MDQRDIAEKSGDTHDKPLPVGGDDEDRDGGRDKGKDGPGDPLERYLSDGTRDKEAHANGWSSEADDQVEHENDAEVQRVHSDLDHQRKQDRRE